jgi:hypothetical protein
MDSLLAEGTARIILGAVCFSVGLWDDAERELMSDAAVACSILVATILRRVTLARLLDQRGRTEQAATILAEIDAPSFPHGAVWLTTMLAAHHLSAGDHAQARHHVTMAKDAQDELGCLACKALLGGVGAEVLATVGDSVGALALAEQAEQAGDGAFPVARLLAARGRVTAAIQAGTWDPAVQDADAWDTPIRDTDTWDTAVREADAALPLADEVGQPFDRALLLLLLGTALSRRGAPGDHERARDLLNDALSVFEGLGARPSIDRAVAELARLSARPVTTIAT